MTLHRAPITGIPGMAPALIDGVLQPYIIETLEAADPRWLEHVGRIEAKMQRPPKALGKGLSSDGVRSKAGVGAHYEELWSAVRPEEKLRDTHAAWFAWRNRGIRAWTTGIKRVHQLQLVHAIEWLAPASVAEIGFGWGLNLLALSVQFPDIRFGGVELTEAGVRAAREIAARADTPDFLRDVVVGEVRDAGALQRLDLHQGSADALPLQDKSVDMVVTVLALEQMERIRPAVLRELARVARRHVVMIEPFRDWNADGARREYIRRYDYWSGAIDDLPTYGLTPIAASADMPQKLTFHVGIVVAAVDTPQDGA